ncbi:MAG: hypothetical protein WD278_12905 [Pirellulales bacterium]
MKTNGDRNRRKASGWRKLTCLAVVGVLLAAAGAQAQAQDVMRVLEDWELVIGQPDAAINSPQVTTIISPLTENDAYCAFNVNYKTEGEYAEGGLQIHVWNPSSPLLIKNSSKKGVCKTLNEVVTWTMEMKLAPGVLSFKVGNGKSTTWGSFGDLGYLEADVGTTIAHLNGYSPQTSVDSSGVSFGGNRVTSLVLKRVRKYDAAGLLISDTSPGLVAHPRQ